MVPGGGIHKTQYSNSSIQFNENARTSYLDFLSLSISCSSTLQAAPDRQREKIQLCTFKPIDIQLCLITCMLCIEGSTLKHLCIRLSILNKYAVCRVKKRLISIQEETSKRATNKTKRTQKDKKKVSRKRNRCCLEGSSTEGCPLLCRIYNFDKT